MTAPSATEPTAPDTSDSRMDQHMAQLLAYGMSPSAAEAMMEIDRTMGQIRKSMARREIGRMALKELKLDIDPADLDVLSVLEGCFADGLPEVTVGLVAERLAIDPSRASRIVAEAVDKGLIRRVASQADARRICIEMTDAGREQAKAIRVFKWGVFAKALGQWSEEDLVTFARLFGKFSTWVADAKAGKL